MARTFTNRFTANGNAPPMVDSACPQSPPTPSGEYAPGHYSPPQLPDVPGLEQSAAWSKCKADCDEIARQLSDAECKRDQARAEISAIEMALSTREPSPAIVARIANAAADLGTLHEKCAALDRTIQMLQRAERLAQATLANLSHIEAVKLRAPFVAIHNAELKKVAQLFEVALAAFQAFWRWRREWSGVGIGQPMPDFVQPDIYGAYGLLTIKLMEQTGRL